MIKLNFRQTKDTSRRPELEAEIIAEFTELFKHGMQIRIHITGNNKIFYSEVVVDITEVNHILCVNIENENIDWLRGQLKDVEVLFPTWVGSDSFDDRQAINERYGFS